MQPRRRNWTWKEEAAKTTMATAVAAGTATLMGVNNPFRYSSVGFALSTIHGLFAGNDPGEAVSAHFLGASITQLSHLISLIFDINPAIPLSATTLAALLYIYKDELFGEPEPAHRPMMAI